MQLAQNPARAAGDFRPYTVNSKRTKAWQNIMVLAINAGLEQGLFTLEPGGNFWPGYKPGDGKTMPNAGTGSHCYSFDFPGGIPVKVYIKDAGYDELSVHVALWPKGQFMACPNAGFLAGEVFAAGWLERQSGLYLQQTRFFSCRKHLLQDIAAIDIKPNGYQV